MTQTATQTLQSFKPATGDVVGEVPVTQPTAIAAVVERAHVAQKGWASKSLAERGEILRQCTTASVTPGKYASAPSASTSTARSRRPSKRT
jgi:acyl-CoA reductase-like NAD-dependent aldehyde dehydrogenase